MNKHIGLEHLVATLRGEMIAQLVAEEGLEPPTRGL